MAEPTDQQLFDKAFTLDDQCRLILSERQQDWLDGILFDDECNVRTPQLTPPARQFLQSIWDGRYTQPNI